MPRPFPRKNTAVRHPKHPFPLVALAVLLAGLPAAAAGGPIPVITTIFPLYDWARIVGGDRVAVSQLLPPGVEAHTFAPKPSDMLALSKARVFVYLGPDLEPWAADLAQGSDNPDLTTVEAGRGLARAGDEGRGHTDPHLWLDPVLAASLVDAIAEGLAAADPDGRETYLANAASYRDALQRLHQEIESGLRTARHREILYGGHFAFGYFARR
jgi:zinc transport system substrate-binding protein